MARAKKNGTYLNVRIENSIYEQLNEICEDGGKPKLLLWKEHWILIFTIIEKSKESLMI